MPVIYETDEQRVFTGATREIPLSGGAPLGWTRLAPPEIPAGKFARWLGSSWEILDEYPVPPKQPPPEGQFSVLRWTIPADASEQAVITYTASDTVYFVVDGAVHTVEPVDGVATLEVFADAPGTIRVEVRDKSAVITAVEV